MCLSRAPRCVNWEHGRVKNLINIVEIFIVSIYHRLIIFLSPICEPALSENDQNNFIIFALWALPRVERKEWWVSVSNDCCCEDSTGAADYSMDLMTQPRSSICDGMKRSQVNCDFCDHRNHHDHCDHNNNKRPQRPPKNCKEYWRRGKLAVQC